MGTLWLLPRPLPELFVLKAAEGSCSTGQGRGGEDVAE